MCDTPAAAQPIDGGTKRRREKLAPVMCAVGTKRRREELAPPTCAAPTATEVRLAKEMTV